MNALGIVYALITVLAWGVVPTVHAGDIEKETVTSLADQFTNQEGGPRRVDLAGVTHGLDRTDRKSAGARCTNPEAVAGTG